MISLLKYLVILIALVSSTAWPFSCPRAVSRLVDTSLGHKPYYSVPEFKGDLALAGLSPWKTKIIEALWVDYARKGYHLVDLRDPDHRHGRLWLPYGLNLPREAVNGLIATANAEGLPPGERYVVIPAKLLLTEGVRRFYSHVFLILSMGLGGKILGVVGLAQSDPLIDQTDPAELADDEVIILVKMDTRVSKEWMNASLMGNLLISHLTEHYPGKFILLDLSMDVPGSAEDKIAALVATLETNHKRVRKIIVASHGSPGTVYGDAVGSLRIESLGRMLHPFRAHFSEKPEVHFDGCMIAGNEEGRKAVDDFGDELLPQGGKVKAERLLSPAGYSAVGAMSPKGMHSADPYNRLFRAWLFLHPVSGEIEAMLMGAGITLVARRQSNSYIDEYSLDSGIFFAPTSYEHVVNGQNRPGE